MDVECFGVRYDVSYCTTKGVRSENQDSFSVVIRSKTGSLLVTPVGEESGTTGVDESIVMVVCDGMGGLEDGASVSRLVSEGLSRWALEDSGGDVASLEESLRGVLKTLESSMMGDHPGSGTTVSMLIGNGSGWYSAHIGDSRCYVVMGDDGRWRTFDHSPVETLRINDIIDEDEMNDHPMSNIVSKYMGGGHADSLEFHEIPEGWRSITVCSDGAFGYMPPEDYWNLLSSDVDSDAVVKAALDGGSRDNVTVVRIVRETSNQLE